MQEEKGKENNMESEKVKEIKKALEYCSNHSVSDCSNVCPYDKYKRCRTEITKDSLTLINELESENERLNKSDTSKEESSIEYYNLYRDFKRENQKLKAEIERLKEVIADQNELCWNCKKSVKDFAEKLKKRLMQDRVINDNVVIVTGVEIDELLKEYEE